MTRLLASLFITLLALPYAAQAQKKRTAPKKRAPVEASAFSETSESQPAFGYVEMNSFEQTPELFHQAPLYRYELTPSFALSRLSQEWTVNGSAGSISILTMSLAVAGEYGFYPLLSAGAQLGYASSTGEYSPSGISITQKGLPNPLFFFKGRYSLGGATLRYGADLSFSMEKSRVSSDGSSNAATGGHTLTPYLGVDVLAMGTATIGGRFSYDLYKGDRTTERSSASGTVTRIKTKGGEQFVLTAFYERPYLAYIVAASIDYASSTNTKTERSGQTFQNKDATSGFALNGYGVVPLATDLNLLPKVTYARVAPSSVPEGATVDDMSVWAFHVALRKMF